MNFDNDGDEDGGGLTKIKRKEKKVLSLPG